MMKILYTLYYFWKARCKHYKTRDALLIDQQKALAKHLDFVTHHSTFYQAYKGQPLSAFPVMNKHKLLAHFDDINTVTLSKARAYEFAYNAENNREFDQNLGGITIGLSSGTSGLQGLYLASPKERAQWAGTMLGNLLPGRLFETHKVALFLRANSPLFSSIKLGTIAFEYFDLFEDFNNNLIKLHCFQPTILVGPSQVLKKIAEAQHKQTINIKPTKIISGAEVLYERDKTYIRDTFACNVDQVYQCAEGLIAMSKRDGTFSFNEDFMVIEKRWLNPEKTKFSPIITDLRKRSLPLIRYEMDDIIEVDSTSDSPYTAIAHIDGRCDDILFVKHKTTSEFIALFPDIIADYIMLQIPNLEDFIIMQLDVNTIEIQINEQEKAVAYHLNTLINAHHGMCPTLIFTPYTAVRFDKKMRRIVRQFKL